MVRYFNYTRGEVSWEEMARWLDTRDLVSCGTHAYILLPKLNIEMVRGIIELIAGHPKDRSSNKGQHSEGGAPESQVAKSPSRAGFVGCTTFLSGTLNPLDVLGILIVHFWGEGEF